MPHKFTKSKEAPRHQSGGDEEIGAVRVEISRRRNADGSIKRNPDGSYIANSECWRIYQFVEPEERHVAQLDVAKDAKVGQPMVKGFWKPVGGQFGKEYDTEDAALKAAQNL